MRASSASGASLDRLSVVALWGVACACALFAACAQPARAASPPSPAEARGPAPPSKPPVPASFLPYDAGWLDVVYPPSARDRVAPLVAHAEQARAELADLLGSVPVDGIEVRVARGLDEMAALAPEALPAHTSSYGMSYPEAGLVVLSLGLPGGEPVDLVEAFRRELASIALHRATGQVMVPRWLDEGFASHFARAASFGPPVPPLELWLAVVSRRLVPLRELDQHLHALDSRAPLAQIEAADWVRYLTAPERRLAFEGTVARLASGEALDSALSAPYGAPLTALEANWRRDLGRRMSWWTLSAVILLGALAGLGAAVMRFVRRRREAAAAAAALEPRPARSARPRTGRAAPSERMHIVFSRRDDRADPSAFPDADVPKVEHEGEWHTLH